MPCDRINTTKLVDERQHIGRAGAQIMGWRPVVGPAVLPQVDQFDAPLRLPLGDRARNGPPIRSGSKNTV